MLGNRKLFNTPEAARYIGRHRSTLDKWRAENIVLPYYKDGRKVLYDRADLDEYLNSLRIEPVACSVRQDSAREEKPESLDRF